MSMNELVNEWGGIKAMALPCRQKPWQKEFKKIKTLVQETGGKSSFQMTFREQTDKWKNTNDKICTTKDRHIWLPPS